MKAKLKRTNVAEDIKPHINPCEGLNARKLRYWNTLWIRLDKTPGKDQIRKVVAYGMHTNLRVMNAAKELAEEIKEATQN